MVICAQDAPVSIVTSKALTKQIGYQDHITTWSFDHTGENLIIGTWKGDHYLYSLKEKRFQNLNFSQGEIFTYDERIPRGSIVKGIIPYLDKPCFFTYSQVSPCVLYDYEKRKVVREYSVEDGEITHHEDQIIDLLVAKNKKLLLTCSMRVYLDKRENSIEDYINFFDIETGKNLGQFQIPAWPKSFAIDPSENLLAIAYMDCIKIWDMNTIKQIKEFHDFEYFNQVKFDERNPKTLLVSGRDRTLFLMNAQDGTILDKIPNLASMDFQMILLDHGKKFLARSEDGSLFLWDFETNQKELNAGRCVRLLGPNSVGFTMVLSPNEEKIAMDIGSFQSGKIIILPVRNLEILKTIDGILGLYSD